LECLNDIYNIDNKHFILIVPALVSLMGKILIVTNKKEDVFNFPCDYPIKVFGINQPDFEKTVCNIVETHTGKLHVNQTTTRRSSKGKYISITVRIIATSRKQLDAINQDLQSCPLVSYLL